MIEGQLSQQCYHQATAPGLKNAFIIHPLHYQKNGNETRGTVAQSKYSTTSF